MGLKIVLDDQHQLEPYFPGQTIRGKIVFHVVKQHNIRGALVTFRGKIETVYIEGRRGIAGNTHGPRKRFVETIRLFELQQILFKGPYDVPPQTFEWPFTFMIPVNCNHRRVGNKSPGFVSDGVNELPPSLYATDHTFSHDAVARIKYKLRVEVDSGSLFRGESEELPVTIARRSCRPPPLASLLPHEYFPSPTWSSRNLREHSHTFKQKFRHALSNDPELKTPCISFRAFIHFPLQLSPQQRTTVGFSIRHFRTTTNDPETPSLVLASLHLTLKSRATMTVACNHALFNEDKVCSVRSYVADHSVVFKSGELPLDGTEIYSSSDTCLMEWQRDDQQGWIGDFDTYIIKQGHTIKAEAAIRHLESGHVFQTKTEFSFTLLDEQDERAAGSSHIEGIAVSRPMDTMNGGDEDLPAYDEDVRPPAMDQSTHVSVPVHIKR